MLHEETKHSQLERNLLEELLSFIIKKDLYYEFDHFRENKKDSDLRDIIEREFCQPSKLIPPKNP